MISPFSIFFIAFILILKFTDWYNKTEIQYYASGEVYSEAETRFGEKHGNYTFYYKSGEIMGYYYYDHGKRTGPYRRYHKNGVVCQSGTIVRDSIVIYNFFDLNGVLYNERINDSSFILYTYYKDTTINEVTYLTEIYKSDGSVKQLNCDSNIVHTFSEPKRIMKTIYVRKNDSLETIRNILILGQNGNVIAKRDSLDKNALEELERRFLGRDSLVEGYMLSLPTLKK